VFLTFAHSERIPVCDAFRKDSEHRQNVPIPKFNSWNTRPFLHRIKSHLFVWPLRTQNSCRRRFRTQKQFDVLSDVSDSDENQKARDVNRPLALLSLGGSAIAVVIA
jgi:hypothetical protein